MFRAQQNAFDEVVAKATDENLTTENWEYIMDVCDKVGNEGTGPKDVVASLIKRLAHRNANVQLYTLELANALSENCGPKIHRELASRAFTDALLRLANDRNTHQQVKAKILERMQRWAEMFSKDVDLGIMNEQYHRLKSQNPNLQPPSAPSKSRLTEVDRRKEEEELQMALKLSIQEKTNQAKAKTSQQSTTSPGTSQTQPQASQPVPSGTTAATVSRVRALFDFAPSEPGELEFRKGDIIAVLESVYKDWWNGSLRGQTGIFPLNYVEKLPDPTPEELQREAQMEAEVFAEIKNVEKLLTLLSTSSSELRGEDNDEITKLYHSTLAIRPKLIELIGKYSQKKDEFTQLNEKFIKARRDYETLLESSMTQPSQPTYTYGRPTPVPPPQPFNTGYTQQNAPPQVEPQKFYPSNPQDQPQYPSQPSSPGFAPRNTPAPFYVVGQPNDPTQPQYPRRDSTPLIPSSSKPTPLQNNSPPPAQYGSRQQIAHQPQTTYSNPQELATTSPTNHGPPSSYSASVYSQEDPFSASVPLNSQLPSQQQYAAYVPLTQTQHLSYEPPDPLDQQVPLQQPQPPQQKYTAYAVPQQPQYEPPAPPIGRLPSPVQLKPGYSAKSHDSRNSLPSQGQYKPYQPSGNAGQTGGHIGSGSPDIGEPAEFYRQSTAY